MKKALINGQTIGLTILGAEAAFSEWSALNPSLFTIGKFSLREGSLEEDINDIRQGMLASLGLIGAMSIGIYLAFGKKGLIPAAAHFGTGLALTALYGFKIGWNKLLA